MVKIEYREKFIKYVALLSEKFAIAYKGFDVDTIDKEFIELVTLHKTQTGLNPKVLKSRIENDEIKLPSFYIQAQPELKLNPYVCFNTQWIFKGPYILACCRTVEEFIREFTVMDTYGNLFTLIRDVCEQFKTFDLVKFSYVQAQRLGIKNEHIVDDPEGLHDLADKCIRNIIAKLSHMAWTSVPDPVAGFENHPCRITFTNTPL